MNPTLIALDAGTTGVTACLFDSDLQLLQRSYSEFPQSFPQPGWVEHDAGEILRAVEHVLNELSAYLEAHGLGTPAALGITNQRETVFALERSSGRPLGPGIVWQDRRTAARCAELQEAGHLARVRETTGLLLDPYFSASKMQWMLEHSPELSERAQRGEVVFVTVDSLVLAHLTGTSGGPAWRTDPTNASRTMLFDIDAACWDADLAELFGLRIEWLAEVLPSTSDFGTTHPERAGGMRIPVRGVAGDQQAALFGQGCFLAGDLKATIGTGSFLLLNTGEQRADSKRGLLSTLAVGPRGEAIHALEGGVFTSGAVVQWLRDGLGIIRSAGELEPLARSVPDTGGIFLVPAFAGLGAPHWDPGARAAILGLTRGSTSAHIARAALEGIAFQNAELVEILREDTGLSLSRLRADGGVASNDLFMQLQADLAGLTTLRGESVEATARGAAALAGVGLQLWDHPGDAAVFRESLQAFEPTMDDPERTARRTAWEAAVARVRTNAPLSPRSM